MVHPTSTSKYDSFTYNYALGHKKVSYLLAKYNSDIN